MKAIAKTLGTALIISGIVFMGWRVSTKISENEVIRSSRQELPSLDFQTLTGDRFSINQLPDDAAVVIMFFHPDCSYCQYEAESLGQKAKVNKDVFWIMVSEAEKVRLSQFSKEYELNELENVLILNSQPGRFYSFFGSEILPSTFVYNRNRKLVKYFKGEVEIEFVLNLLS